MFTILTLHHGSAIPDNDYVFCVPMCLGGRVAEFIFVMESGYIENQLSFIIGLHLQIKLIKLEEYNVLFNLWAEIA